MKLSFAEEPAADHKEVVQIVFRKPLGNERLTRKFLKSDSVQRLYDYIDMLSPEEVGFESASEIKYELVLPP